MSVRSDPPLRADRGGAHRVARARRRGRSLARRRGRRDVTLPQYRALVVLAARGPQRMGDLAEALGVHPSTATRLCDRLVDRQLVRRAVDRTNRRETTITLVAQGPRRWWTRSPTFAAPRSARSSSGSRCELREPRVAALRAFADAAGEPPAGGLDPGLDVNDRTAPILSRRRAGSELRTLRSHSQQVLRARGDRRRGHRAGRRRLRAPRRRGPVRARARAAAVAASP